MKSKQIKFILFIGFWLFIQGSIGSTWAEEPLPLEDVGVAVAEEPVAPEDAGDLVVVDADEAPAFQNPTQAQKAMNVAEAWAAKEDEELIDILDQVDQAKKDLQNAQNQDHLDQGIINEKQFILEGLLDEAKERMAGVSGTKSDEIGQMRDDGMGWGEIAHELGLHPGVLGQGHVKNQKFKKGWGTDSVPGEEISDQDILAATARDFKEGKAKGYKEVNGKTENSGKSGAAKENKAAKASKSPREKSNNGKKK